MQQLFSAISSVLKEYGAEPGLEKAIVYAAWSHCAGEMLSSRTKPLDFTDKHLIVAVDDKNWKRQLEELSPKLLVKLNEVLGQDTVRFIEFTTVL